MITASKSSKATINDKDYNLIAFYFPDRITDWDDWYKAPYFGNFWKVTFSLTIDNIVGEFKTAEAAFQATKWWKHDSIRKQFADADSGTAAFNIKKQLSESPDYSYCGLGRDGAMKAVLKAKFQDPELKTALLATGDAYLLEHNETSGRDDYWSDNNYTRKDKHVARGQNMLGICLMELRAELGGQDSPCTTCQVVDFTNQVKPMYKDEEVSINTTAAAANIAEAATTDDKVSIVPSVYKKDNEVGDFLWMIDQDEYSDAFFIYNDNKSQFLEFHSDPRGPSACYAGLGNGKLRPWQCKTPPHAAGIPTGPNFTGLTEDVKKMIDDGITYFRKTIKANNYKRVIFSSDGHGGLGTSIFDVPQEVKDYIIKGIYSLAEDN